MPSVVRLLLHFHTDLTLDEVRRLDAGSWFDPGFAGEKVPTVEEVLKLVAAGLTNLEIAEQLVVEVSGGQNTGQPDMSLVLTGLPPRASSGARARRPTSCPGSSS